MTLLGDGTPDFGQGEIKPQRWARTRLTLVAAATASFVTMPGAAATPHQHDCTLAAASATCTEISGGRIFTTPKRLDVLPHSDDPRWLALGYNPKWPQLGYNPKWRGFGYEPQYKGFQPPAGHFTR
jgi:hypothetical protein